MPEFSSGNIHEGEFNPSSIRPQLPIGLVTKAISAQTSIRSSLPISSNIISGDSERAEELAKHDGSDVNAADLHQVIPMVHKWSHTHSILSVVAAPSKDLIICGTQDSKILFFEISTFALKHTLNNGERSNSASILCLTLDPEENFLFSAGLDSLVKVWDLRPFTDKNAPRYDIKCTHLVYSSVDIGDIFSISWSSLLSTLFIGAQNASILWCLLDLYARDQPEYEEQHCVKLSKSINRLPQMRFDKFFDSKGPGGSLNRVQNEHHKFNSNLRENPKGPLLVEIENGHIIQFAHNGYVYCMEFLSLDNAPEFCDLQKNLFSTYLATCGGDGVLKLWGISAAGVGILRPQIMASLANDEAILSMYVCGSSIYLGLVDSSINIWDLTTYQLTRSFHFNSSSKKNDEILSLCIFNGFIYKATNRGGLCQFTAKKDLYDLGTESKHPKSCMMDLNLDYLNDASLDEHDGNSVFAVQIFKLLGSTYLISGGTGSLCLWNITNVGSASRITGESELSTGRTCSDDLSNEHLLESLESVIAFRTISKYPVSYLEESRQCARFFSKLFMNLEAFETKLLPVPNCNPIVYASFKRDNAGTMSEKPKRVLWYGHYDVVDAVQDSEKWDSDPFRLTAKDGCLYARGVSDNKGPTLAAIYAVAKLKRERKLSTDVVFLIEGEEECGSVGFQDAVNKHKDIIGGIDWIMLSNSYWLDDETPCLNYGLRGVINASISVQSEKPDRHSGVDGGVSREPTMDLIQVLGQLSCPETNKIKIPGFYDDLLALEDSELRLYEKIRKAAKKRGVPETNLESLLAKWRSPSLTVHRVDVSGPLNNTVISQTARASISMRIVPNQDLAKIKSSLVQYLNDRFAALNSENKMSIDIFHEAEPWLGDPNSLVYKLLFEKMKKNWGASVPEPLFIREGGSIPSIRFLEKAFSAPAAQIPCGQASDNAHLKDERLRVLNLLKLRDILHDTFEDLGLNH